MELLVLLVLLVLAGALVATGHSADSREPGYSWDPSLERR